MYKYIILWVYRLCILVLFRECGFLHGVVTLWLLCQYDVIATLFCNDNVACVIMCNYLCVRQYAYDCTYILICEVFQLAYG
jgi:hypothetical protein